MCGFAALISNQRNSPDFQGLIRNMTDAMVHRGPDAEGHYSDECVALGHRRLSIIDLSELGNQPMWDQSGRYAVVFNGEIYNYRELKSELGAYPFRSQSDTEVLLAGFSAWGPGLFIRLNGIFAFALYDKAEKKLFLVRDRFGVKPLYFTQFNDSLAAASEQRALLKLPAVQRTINTEALSDYLLNGAVFGNQRIAEGIQQLPAGAYAIWQYGAMATEYYFQLQDTPSINIPQDPVLIRREIKHLLTQAVSRQLMSDVPLGAFLSGGIDSSALVALMSEVSPSPPLTFTIGFEEKKFDETVYATTVAKKFNTRHTVLTLKPEDFLASLPKALSAMDTPTLDGINTFMVSRITRQAGVTVALSGLGGDEIFAGYETFKRFVDWKQKPWWRLPLTLRRLAASGVRLSPAPKLKRIARLLAISEYTIDQVYPIFRGIFDPVVVRQLLPDTSGINNPAAQWLIKNRPDIQRFDLLSQYSLAELHGYTRNMLLKDTDQMSMASSLEVRVPFFDNDLVSYALNVADQHKYPHTPKQLLVESLGDLLPAEIVNRPKMGFTLPWDSWLRNELNDFCFLHIQALADRHLFNNDALMKLWYWFLSRKNNVLWSHIWMFVVLEYWLQNNLDKHD